VSIIDGIFTQKSGSTGKEENGNPGSGGEGFPSHSAIVVSHFCCWNLSFHTFPRQCVKIWFFDEEAGSEDHPVSRGQGELLRGQRLVTANQWALVELSS